MLPLHVMSTPDALSYNGRNTSEFDLVSAIHGYDLASEV